VVPPSRHACGDSYRWSSDPFSTRLAQVPGWLADRLEAHKRDEPIGLTARKRRPLTAEAESLLLHGDPDEKYTSRSEAEQAIAAGARNAGWDYASFEAAILDPNHVGGRKAQGYASREADLYLRRTWKSAGRLPRAERPNPPEITEAVVAADNWIESRPWSGASGQSDWAVAQAILFIVEDTRKLRFELSVRQTGELAGVERDTAARCFKRLLEVEFIAKIAEASEGRATTYELRGSDTRHTGGAHMSVTMEQRRCGAAFRRVGLRPTARRIWLLLCTKDGLVATEISDRLGINKSTAYDNLRALESLGMVNADGRPMRWFSFKRDLEEVAAELGVSGAGLRQKLSHEVERKGYFLATRLRSKQETNNR
jgi:predicted transcriptional regulator